MSNDFPAMIYHFTQGQKIINSSDELSVAKREGWQTAPFEMDEKTVIEKIAWYEREIEMLKAKLVNVYTKTEPVESRPEPEPEQLETEPKKKRKYTRRS